MRCAFCHEPLVYVHGHAACVRHACPFYGQNQAECCSGETAENCAVTTSDAARVVMTQVNDDSRSPPDS